MYIFFNIKIMFWISDHPGKLNGEEMYHVDAVAWRFHALLVGVCYFEQHDNIQMHGPLDSKLYRGYYYSIIASCLGHPVTGDEKGVSVLLHLKSRWILKSCPLEYSKGIAFGAPPPGKDIPLSIHTERVTYPDKGSKMVGSQWTFLPSHECCTVSQQWGTCIRDRRA